jgi:hypothetical protein
MMSWIDARIKCSLESAWIALRETVCLDIDRWRELSHTAPDSPSIVQQDGRLIISSKEKDDSGESVAWATVEKKQKYIRVRVSDPAGTTVELQFVPRLNDAGECRLFLGEKELEFWQVSRKILEPVLFG